MSLLLSPIQIRGEAFRNRVFLSPMCQYSGTGGMANDWHLVHLGSRAVGGVALTMVEATAVLENGMISAADLGLWSDEQIEPLRRLTDFIASQGAVPGIQLAHAGRKASGPIVFAPSSIPFNDKTTPPKEMSTAEIAAVVVAFGEAAERAVRAGFRVVEIHAAHGYLLHEFLSPLSNRRDDEFGGDFGGRIKFLLDVVKTVRTAMPSPMPLFVRISASDWAPGGWEVGQSVALSLELKTLGVDLIDCSSGGILPGIPIPVSAGYQLQFSKQIREEATILTAGVGLITDPMHAEKILATGEADALFLGRALLRDPYWVLHAAQLLSEEAAVPVQYERANFFKRV